MKFLRAPGVKDVFGWPSDTSLYEAQRDGTLTKGIPIGLRSKGWPDYECQALANARVAGYNDDQLRALVTKLHAQRAELAATI
ncbi:MAG: hypothetical protein KBF66_04900 [Rhodoferax sp.]|uniref:helix-turn-helix transcriptional regulator n=1 Tax=Rhodoferax sp. TaxID=50421 RepID=UPI001B6ECB37|nr:hypothetical protein [Rhodoferax sp.]MBP9904874.1 hypothetical protein [Rhodoferax sp.]